MCFPSACLDETSQLCMRVGTGDVKIISNSVYKSSHAGSTNATQHAVRCRTSNMGCGRVPITGGFQDAIGQGAR